MRNYQNKLTKNNIFIDNLRNHGIMRLIIDELEKYVVLTLKNWGGGYKYVHKKVFFRIKKNIYIETNKYDFIKAFYIM